LKAPPREEAPSPRVDLPFPLSRDLALKLDAPESFHRMSSLHLGIVHPRPRFFLDGKKLLALSLTPRLSQGASQLFGRAAAPFYDIVLPRLHQMALHTEVLDLLFYYIEAWRASSPVTAILAFRLCLPDYELISGAKISFP